MLIGAQPRSDEHSDRAAWYRSAVMDVKADGAAPPRVDERLALHVCRRYYLDGETKQEIAKALGISRFKVARLITTAQELGLVRIELRQPSEQDDRLAGELKRRFDLCDARVLCVDDPDSLTSALGRASAQLLCTRLRPGDVLGIGWGTTVQAVVEALATERPARPVDVVQLRGGVHSVELAFNAIELARRAAELLGGLFSPLYAPALLRTVEAREALLREPAIAETVARFAAVTVALTGIGALRPHPTLAYYRSGSLGPEALAELERAGAVGDVFGQYVDADGSLLPQFAARTMAPTLEALQHVPLRIGVAGGAAKTLAIAAALRSRWINALVTDADVAQALLQLPHLEHADGRVTSVTV
ncbi:MAG: sugar-binding transcriptional regulator [Chloroflexi bacterium]|nr:sugar-binding transcriptional regulator [Chloroflexota bacterium]